MFGLGNRQYEHFCVIGKRVSKRMADMGATEIVPHGEGDDDGRRAELCALRAPRQSFTRAVRCSLEDDYAEWKAKFWEEAKSRYLSPEERVEVRAPACPQATSAGARSPGLSAACSPRRASSRARLT